MASSTNLARLYMGAGYTPKQAGALGTGTATVGGASYQVRRRRLLQQGLKKGTIKQSQLGESDANLLGFPVDPPKNVLDNGTARGIGGFFKNLGTDIWQAGKYAVPGLYETAKAGAVDLSHLLNPGFSVSGNDLRRGEHESQLKKKVIDPTVASYKETYGGIPHGDFSGLYKHPLNPILDLATVASLGAGGVARAAGAASRAGIISDESRLGSLARLTDTRGRGPAYVGGGENPIEVTREYSSKPLHKLSQIAVDKIAEKVPRLAEHQGSAAYKQELRQMSSLGNATTNRNVTSAVSDLGPALKALDADETIALNLAIRQVNTPERIATFKNSVAKSLRNEHEDGKNIQDFEELGIDPKYVSRLRDLTPRTEELILNPLSSPRLMKAAELWNKDQERGRAQLGIDEEAHQNMLAARRDMLGGNDPVDYPITPDYAADMLPTGFKDAEDVGPIGRAFGKGGTRVEKAGSYNPREVNASNLLTPRRNAMRIDESGAAFMAGVFRTDGRAMLDHIARRERDVVEEAFNQEIISRFSLKDANGEERKFSIGEDGIPRDKEGNPLPKGYKQVSPEFPLQWFKGEINMVEGTLNVVNALRKEGHDEFSLEAEQALLKYQNNHAEAFIKSEWSAMRKPSVGIPDEVYDYQMKIATVRDPYKYGAFNWMAKWMHRWRTATLAYMPRWALNTAAGSFLMALIKGVVRPGDYMTGNRLARTFVDAEGTQHVVPSRLQRMRGAETPEVGGMEQLMPAGIDLKSASLQDYLEPGMPGQADYGQIGVSVMSPRRITDFVQSIEDFFRRAHFVQNLRGEAKQLMLEQGDSMKDFYETLGDKPLVEQWLEDPYLVDKARQEVDKWSYAYGELGPYERRYVRQVIPFWGWYKFITKFAWRLPMDNPFRANAIRVLSTIGHDSEAELGLIPPWVRGSIMLNLQGGRLKYLSTLGLNPLSQFANPLSPEGMKGFVTMGQGSPVIQAFLAAMGYDTLRGGAVPMSPQLGVGRDFYGNQVDVNTGEVVDPATRGGMRRGVGALLRAFPMYRMGEQYFEGGSVYPDSVPILADRPMARSGNSETPSIGNTILMPTFGINPGEYDIANYQRGARKAANFSSKLQKRSIKRILESQSR